ncbi:MAG TPA: threonine--tRNA ligase [Candidatus Cryosericum sp.]|nr:threonine--tRNA ligase [Candidatus Cryosericum sp.]
MDIKLVLGDHSSVYSFAQGETILAAVEKAFPEQKRSIVAARLGGSLIDLTTVPTSDETIELVTTASTEGLEILRHSASHIMAEAIKELYPDAKLAIGPAIDSGFYYDIDMAKTLTPEDLGTIEAKMHEITQRSEHFTRRDVPIAEAIQLFKEQGDQYKVEILSEIPATTVSLYTQGAFTDLCRGPHIPSTGYLKHFKLLSIAGAYWRGDEKNKMLQRIYGTAFPSKDELTGFITAREEAAKRDHRKLGQQLDLFSIQEQAGPGLVFWHPKGAIVRKEIEDFWRAEHIKRGYEFVYTPHIANLELWKTSGHWGFYQQNMYSPLQVDEEQYMLKPMNCPFHILIYKSQVRSYRDLPLRWAELGTVYRYEKSGVLHGLLRVRGFTQDDAHLFVRPDQLNAEVKGVLDFTRYMIETFGFTKYNVYLSTRPEHSVGSDENWEMATEALRVALTEMQLPYKIDPGEGVFYGPKIDVKLVDAIGREWQGPTVQVDFNLPERFDVTYIGEDGKEHRPVMLHRVVLGSMERFFGTLIEQYAGAFPVWLAPVQVEVVPITDVQEEYAAQVADRLSAQGIRAKVDTRREKMQAKIRDAELQKIPYIAVVGVREASTDAVAVRKRHEGDQGVMQVDEFLEKVLEDIRSKVIFP